MFSIFIKILTAIIFLTKVQTNETENDEFLRNEIKTKHFGYAYSIAGLLELLELEREIIEYISDFKELNLKTLNFYLAYVRKEHEKAKIEEPENYLANPLNSFALINRVNFDWNRWNLYLQDENLLNRDILEKFRPKMATLLDLELAAKSIFRLIDAYELKIDDFVVGLINGKQYNASLTSADCSVLGFYSYQNYKFKDAITYFQWAIKLSLPNNEELLEILEITLSNIWYHLAETWVQLSNYEEYFKAMDKALFYDPNNTMIMDIRSQAEEAITHNQLCRGEVLRKSSNKDLCYYNHTTTPFLKLAPLKMERISEDPFVTIIHNIISDREIEELIDYAKPLLARGYVGQGFRDNDRTAHGTNFQANHSKLLGRIHQRLNDISGFTFGEREFLHVTNYGFAGHFYNHVDYTENKDFRDLKFNMGDRIAAILLYLSDVEEGGYTAFINLKVAVPPSKGSAVLWYNLDNAGNGNPTSMHASCPVIVGSKWAAIKLIYEPNQMFVKPCFR